MQCIQRGLTVAKQHHTPDPAQVSGTSSQQRRYCAWWLAVYSLLHAEWDAPMPPRKVEVEFPTAPPPPPPPYVRLAVESWTQVLQGATHSHIVPRAWKTLWQEGHATPAHSLNGLTVFSLWWTVHSHPPAPPMPYWPGLAATVTFAGVPELPVLPGAPGLGTGSLSCPAAAPLDCMAAPARDSVPPA